MKSEDILESVVSLLALDGAINKHEMQFFHDLCKRLEVSKETSRAVLEKAKQGKGRIHLPGDDTDKKRLLYFLVQAVVADGKVVQKERDVLSKVIDKLQIPRDYVENFLNSRLQEIKTERYSVQHATAMTCPKCGYQQTASYRCKRCGIIFEKYQESQQQPVDDDEERLRQLLASSNKLLAEE